MEPTSIADLIYAATMLKLTPRSGYAFLGTGRESVAEHSFGTAFIGMVLAKAAQADIARVVFLCLTHDLHEAATGDFNYVNHRYDHCDTMRALAHICAGSGQEDFIQNLHGEFCQAQTLEARLANDADQLDFICSLRREEAKGNSFASEWLKTATLRLKTEAGKGLCAAILATSPHHWWYDGVDKSWWINRATPADSSNNTHHNL